jgi:hypothetical protein
MSNSNLKIDLYERKDRNKKIFYVGKLKGDFNLNFSKGVSFLIFVSDNGDEQLQIAPMDSREENDE